MEISSTFKKKTTPFVLQDKRRLNWLLEKGEEGDPFDAPPVHELGDLEPQRLQICGAQVKNLLGESL